MRLFTDKLIIRSHNKVYFNIPHSSHYSWISERHIPEGFTNLIIKPNMCHQNQWLVNFLLFSRDWWFGERYCTISNFIATVTVAASVFTLTGISCDRYLAIVHPLQPRISRTAAVSTIAVIWAISAALGTPYLLYSRTLSYTFRDRVRVACVMVWPDGLPNVSDYDYM